MNKKSILLWPMIIMSSVSYAEIYEDAEDGNTDGWAIFGALPENVSITNLYDVDKQSNVIQFSGNGLKNRYRLGHPQISNSTAWNNTEDNVLKWSMNYSENFFVNVLVTTREGRKTLRYLPQDIDRGIKGSLIRYGLGVQAKNGTWQTFTRNLEADLKVFESSNKIISIQGITIRGSGSVDDIETYNDGTNTDPVIIPIDSNIELGNEPGILYYADPRVEENGLNRALRIDYLNWSFEAISVQGINPHSIDRAGATDKFYMRTQNSYSFDVVNFKEGSVKTVSLGDHKPRAIGAHNQKYNIQLLSAKNMPVVSVIDVETDTVIATVGDRNTYDNTQLTSNAGSGSATGHALWLDEDHFVLIDRVNLKIVVYKVTQDAKGNMSFNKTSEVSNNTAYHAVEKVNRPISQRDLVTFYGLAEGDLTINVPPGVHELRFDPATGVLTKTRAVNFNKRNQAIENVKPSTHHAGISPDGKFIVVPSLEGRVYFVNRKRMKIKKIIKAKLGAAHVEFSQAEGIAVITNHFDNFLTIIDMETLEVKKQLQIGFDHEYDKDDKHLLQPHFSYIGSEGRYFYTFATQDGKFIKIDLRTLEIIDVLETGGAPEQAHS